jgi:hypothetical protein
MDVGTSIVVNDYIATTAAAYEGIPFILNAITISNGKLGVKNIPVKRYLNVIEYLEREGLSTYINQISSKLQVSFSRSVFTYSVNSNKKIIINVFFARMRSAGNSNAKGGNEILKVGYASKGDEAGDPNLSIINAAFAERQGSAIRAELMYGPNIQKDEIYNRFVITLQSCINDNPINNRSDVTIDQAFFFPIKSYEYDKLDIKCQATINDLLEPSNKDTKLRTGLNNDDDKMHLNDLVKSNRKDLDKAYMKDDDAVKHAKPRRKTTQTRTGVRIIDAK